MLVLEEIVQEDAIWRSKQDKDRDRLERRKREQEEKAAKMNNDSPVAESATVPSASEAASVKSASLKPLTGFY